MLKHLMKRPAYLYAVLSSEFDTLPRVTKGLYSVVLIVVITFIGFLIKSELASVLRAAPIVVAAHNPLLDLVVAALFIALAICSVHAFAMLRCNQLHLASLERGDKDTPGSVQFWTEIVRRMNVASGALLIVFGVILVVWRHLS